MKILLAVSGGIDSMCMADILTGQGARAGAFAVAHCNFHLRGAESDADCEFVRSWAERSGLPFYVADFQTSEYAREHGLSIEMAARELRYGWFAQLCREQGFDAVAVGHNANDNAETLILNLLRGTGSRGLCGMSPDGRVPGAPDVRLLRPLLRMSRAEISRYAAEHGIAYREDSTNADIAFKRNLVRHSVFPLFEQLNPSFLRTLNRETEVFGAMNAALDAALPALRDRIAPDGRIDLKILKRQGGWEYWLYRFCEDCGLSGESFDSLLSYVRGGRYASGKVFAGSRGRVVSAGKEALVIDTQMISPSALSVSGEGEFAFGERGLKVELFDRPSELGLRQQRGTLIFDGDKLSFPLMVRPWQEGDWMRPFGMKGRKKLSDLFNDLDYSLVDKERAAVLELSGSHVAALLPERIDDSLKVTGETRRILRITIYKIYERRKQP
ncbi:MAG: tRNA lysidine(34) synthetase TilS [Bacteroidales bacterium]|nr:tRNA lysidine(34) synthetase TilS [Bacteroidales bacterium]